LPCADGVLSLSLKTHSKRSVKKGQERRFFEALHCKHSKPHGNPLQGEALFLESCQCMSCTAEGCTDSLSGVHSAGGKTGCSVGLGVLPWKLIRGQTSKYFLFSLSFKGVEQTCTHAFDSERVIEGFPDEAEEKRRHSNKRATHVSETRGEAADANFVASRRRRPRALTVGERSWFRYLDEDGENCDESWGTRR
jgi:hypothetical protein